MDFTGYTLRVIKECPLLEIGQMVYCINDCRERRIFIVWSNKEIFGVNQINLPYERRGCFKII